MKETALTERHMALGARMAEFAGYNMPISYTTIKEEHQAVRHQVGLFDVSHMGEFVIKGKEALDLIQKVTSNDASQLEIGEAQYSCLPNAEGGIVDDLLVYRLDEDQCSAGERAYMLVVNASNIVKDWDWISKHNNFDTRLINISEQTSLLALQGPLATDLLSKLTQTDVFSLKYYTAVKGTVAGISNVLISATGYTGSGGFELYVENKNVGQIWDTLFAEGEEMGLKPIGLGARDTLRLEMGYCLYGNDINDETSPLEAGLGWITKLKKGDFIGSDKIKLFKENGIQKRLVGFKVDDRRVPRHGYPILDNDQVIGEVTSGTLSPSLGIPIGIGYVHSDYRKSGSKFFIQAGKKLLPAEVVKLPFFRPGKD